MSIAIFKSVLNATEGETVWGKLRQKIVDAAEAPVHLAEGWYNSAAEALEAHELAVLEAENVKLQEQITAEQTKLDGRTKAAKELKAKLGNGSASGAQASAPDAQQQSDTCATNASVSVSQAPIEQSAP